MPQRRCSDLGSTDVASRNDADIRRFACFRHLRVLFGSHLRPRPPRDAGSAKRSLAQCQGLFGGSAVRRAVPAEVDFPQPPSSISNRHSSLIAVLKGEDSNSVEEQPLGKKTKLRLINSA